MTVTSTMPTNSKKHMILIVLTHADHRQHISWKESCTALIVGDSLTKGKYCSPGSAPWALRLGTEAFVTMHTSIDLMYLFCIARHGMHGNATDVHSFCTSEQR